MQLGIAQVAADFGRFDVAHGAASRALELKPESARAMTMLAYVYANVGVVETAEHWIARADQPGEATSHWHPNVVQAAVYLQQGELRALIAFLEAQIVQQCDPDPLLFFSPRVWQAYGGAGTGRMLAGAYQEAAECFERYLQSIGDIHVTQIAEDAVPHLGEFADVNQRISTDETFDRTLVKAVAAAEQARQNGWNTDLLTFYEARLRVLELDKPVIAAVAGPAVAGPAVAGGMELALWCDFRVVQDDAYFGVYCRRWGVPLIDGGTMRLPRIVGQGRALEIILTGRQVCADDCRLSS